MGISPLQIGLLLVIGILIFGKNLPEVARKVGSVVMEFKKGLNEMREITKLPTASSLGLDAVEEAFEELETDKHEFFGAKFEPPVVDKSQ